jgi:hypothetical protein
LEETSHCAFFEVDCETLETIRYSQTKVELLDLLQSLQQLHLYEKIRTPDAFVPNYGSLPGPVKLLQLGNAVV